MRSYLLAGVLLGTLIAGCADAGPKADPEDDEIFAGLDDDVKVTGTSGAIAGVVVDQAIRPILNATVRMTATGESTTTDQQGRFAFEGLKPGAYFLSAEAFHFEGAQLSVDVVAGQVETVRIMLVALTSAVPYHDTLHFEGYVDFWAGFGQFAVEVIAPGTLACECAWKIYPDANLATLMFEADGTVSVPSDGTPITDDGDVYWELIAQNGSGQIKSEYEDFPFSFRFDNDTLEAPDQPYLARITGGVWPSGNMDYDLFVTLFYNEEAPDGWSFLAGDT